MRKALIDAEMELQQSAVATQDRRKALQARLFAYKTQVESLHLQFVAAFATHCMPFKACSNGFESICIL